MENIEKLIETFSLFDDWEEKYQYLIELGEKLPPLDEKYKTDEFKVSGCQSQVWLVPIFNGENFSFLADSDAIMVKGIIAVLMAIYANKSVKEIKKIEVENFFAKLGLGEHLSPSRRNGMMSMVDKIRYYADKA
ncbi:MAG: SufE family protein [Alphaproteobacteria bacterium]|nr:SufE family protein [Alphaproteobacteria bacterium]